MSYPEVLVVVSSWYVIEYVDPAMAPLHHVIVDVLLTIPTVPSL